MSLNAYDKRVIVINYVREFGYRQVEISKATQIPLYTITQMLHCDDWEPDDEVLTKVMLFLETGRQQTNKHVFCNGSGCQALKAYLAEKDHLIETQNETIKMLRDKIKTLSKSG